MLSSQPRPSLRYQQPRVSVVRLPPPQLPPPEPEPIQERDWILTASEPPKKITALDIRAKVMKVLGISYNDFVSPRRARHIVRARMVFYYVCKKNTSLSFPHIGQYAGNKDHSTVMHGVRTVEDRPLIFGTAVAAVMAALEA